MPNLPTSPVLPQHPGGQYPETQTWVAVYLHTFSRIWSQLVQTLNGLSKVDTLANRTSTPIQNEQYFVASDTYQQYVGIAGVWEAVGRVDGDVMGAIPFTEISDPAAPAANGGRLYVRDNGAGKSQLVCRFNTGAIQVIVTEP